MIKPDSSLADQLQALGGLEGKSHTKPKQKSEKSVSDFRSKAAREPKVGDLEAEMAKMLADANAQSEKAEKPSTRRIKPAKRNAPIVVVETRKSLPSRVVDPSRKPGKPAQRLKEPKGGLTQSAQERLHYEPQPPVKEASKDPTKPPAAPKREPAALNPAPRENPCETRPLKAAEAFEHITRIVGSSTPAIEVRHAEIEADEARGLDEAVQKGAEWLRNNPDPDFENGFVVGFDFGTSSLKVVVRDPYVAGNPVAAMPAPEKLRSQGHPYLWQTVVWFDPSGDTFLLYPTPGSIALEGFKTGIIAGKGAEPVCHGAGISRSEAASAFITLHLCHLLGWYEVEKPLARCKAKNFLAINIGVPVATSDNPSALQPFKEVVRAAVELASSCEPLTLERVRAALEMVQAEDLPEGFDLIPELSAALVGYASDPTSPWGAHVLIDVGASTLDMVAFNLVDNDDEAQIKAFSASVELLGAAALEIARNEAIADEDFRKACNYQFGDTYGYACREDVAPMNFSKTSNPERKDVQLVVTGGGCATSVHSSFIRALRSPARVLGPGDIARPEPPREIAVIECDRSRLLLAFGLAHDIPDIPPPTLPSRIPKIKAQPVNQPTYVGPEQT